MKQDVLRHANVIFLQTDSKITETLVYDVIFFVLLLMNVCSFLISKKNVYNTYTHILRIIHSKKKSATRMYIYADR